MKDKKVRLALLGLVDTCQKQLELSNDDLKELAEYLDMPEIIPDKNITNR